MNKLKNHFIVNGIREEKQLQAWVDNQVGERNAKVFTEKGLEAYVVSFMPLGKWKSTSQNRLFWSLIDCFWQSGCSSFYSYEELKEHYYRLAGLIEIKTKSTFSKETKKMLYEAIKILPLVFTEKQKVYKFLKGEYEKHLSWSVAKKDKAKLTIDTLIHDMNEAKVSTNKYEEILRGIDY